MSANVRVPVADLAGPALDWAVAKVAGVRVRLAEPHYGTPWRPYRADYDGSRYNPSENWGECGPLIDQHCKVFGLSHDREEWRAFAYRPFLETGLNRLAGGPTALIAFCRALVLVHLGDEIDIPAVLAGACHG